ncbi:MAG: hypothetical protein R3B07_04475 [Polyangiaceae bacterium]
MTGLCDLRVKRWGLLALIASGSIVVACGEDVDVGSMGDGGAGTSNGASGGVGGSAANGGTAGNGGSAGSLSGNGGAAGSASGGTTNGGTTNGGAGGSGSCVPTKCQNHLYQCGNCLDDDNDGLIDSEDPDCLGPCDNTEDSTTRGSPAATKRRARWIATSIRTRATTTAATGRTRAIRCRTRQTTTRARTARASTTQTRTSRAPARVATNFSNQDAQCEAYCGPLTPNGCDCFGCCELPAGSGKFVYLGSEVNKAPTCTRDDVGRPHQVSSVYAGALLLQRLWRVRALHRQGQRAREL